MRIVLLAPVEEPVPPRKYGGTELVVSHLAEEMTKKGHEVYLLASGDSHTKGHLVPLRAKSLRTEYSATEIDKWRDVAKLDSLGVALKKIYELEPDVVFNHVGWRFVPFIQLMNCPVFTTIHGPLHSQNEKYIYEHYPQTSLISISDNQRLAMPDQNWVKTIYNGITVPEPSTVPIKDREYFAFLGRTSPEKGLKEICQTIKKTKHKLKIAAKIDTVDQAYFDQEIKPLIDGKQIEFIGEIGPDQKQNFLKNAKALLLWFSWEEPFGLVIVEALANGTPAIVNPRGAMPELMIDQKTGFLAGSLAEMQQSLDNVVSIDPRFCHDHVLKNFSARRMAQEYLQLAGSVIHG